MNWTPADVIALIVTAGVLLTVYTAVVILLTRGQYRAAEEILDHDLPAIASKSNSTPEKPNEPHPS